MKHKTLLISGLMVLALLLASCGPAATTQAPAAPATEAMQPTEAPPTEPMPTEMPTEAPATEAPATEPPAAAEGPIVIGASLPLSGDFSEPGSAAKQGYEVWAAMVNDSGGLLGRQVELSIVDNASDQDTAVADYEKLITVDKVDLVVGPFSSLLVIPTSEVAARYGYAFVEPAGGAPDVFNRGLTNLFFAQPARGAEQAIPFADYILGLPEDMRPKTYAVVSQDDPFTLGVMDGLKERLNAGGLDLVFDEVYAPDTTDFSSIAIQVADLDPDLIVGGTVFQDSVGQVLQQAVENIQSLDNTALIDEIHKTEFKTVVGPLSFDEVGAPQGSFMLLQWQGDTFVIVGPGERARAEAIWPKPAW